METKPAFIVAFAGKVVVDAGWGRHIQAFALLRLAVRVRKQGGCGPAGSFGPGENFGKDARENAEDGADAELQQGADRNSRHLEIRR